MDFATTLQAMASASQLVTPEDIAQLDDEPGAYILALNLTSPLTATIGRREAVLSAGWYAYAGSANGPGGIKARLARHFDTDKKKHWHIDQLSIRAKQRFALAVESGDECMLAAQLDRNAAFNVPMTGFGSSDCAKCSAHLFAYNGN